MKDSTMRPIEYKDLIIGLLALILGILLWATVLVSVAV